MTDTLLTEHPVEPCRHGLIGQSHGDYDRVAPFLPGYSNGPINHLIDQAIDQDSVVNLVRPEIALHSGVGLIPFRCVGDGGGFRP